MFGKIRSIFGGGATEKRAQLPRPTRETIFAPQQNFWAIGDIHGCNDNLDRALEHIKDDFVVTLGDMVDRGPQSADVLTRLWRLQTDKPSQVVCLMGNHEQMLLEFIDDPAGLGARWLGFGGRETLESFGISDASKRPDAEEALELADRFEDALPEGMQNWLRNLPISWNTGNIWCVHAGMNPKREPEKQSERTLLWGHPEFYSASRDDDICVVHGHTIMEKAGISDGRIALDTGAYQGHGLTAGHISTAGCTLKTF